MQLSNRRTLLSVQTESSDSEIVMLQGDATIDDGKVVNFSGQVMPAVTSDADPGVSHGNFSYTLDYVNIHVPPEYRKAVSALLDKTIEDIERELSQSTNDFK